MKLTTAAIKSIRLPPGIKDKIYFDSRLPGFGLRVRENGVHSWMVQYRFGASRKSERIVLGLLTALSPDEAFNTAKDLLAKVRLGANPAAEKRVAHVKAKETFDAILPRYLTLKRTSLKPRTYEEVERHLARNAKPLHALPVDLIGRSAIASLLDDVERESGGAARNNLRSYLSAFFMWLAREGRVDTNPVAVTNRAMVKSRDHVLGDSDVRTILAALNEPSRVDDDHNDIVKLLLLLGLRREEVGALRWDEIDFDHSEISLSGDRTKNSKPWLVPLSGPALAILQTRHSRRDAAREFVFGRKDTGFSGWSKGKTELDAEVAKANGGKPITPWRLHDFRRYVSTVMNERLGVDERVVEALLGHVIPGIKGVYNRGAYLSERKRALDRWATWLEEIATGKPPEARVINLGKGRR
jgi:integrase